MGHRFGASMLVAATVGIVGGTAYYMLLGCGVKSVPVETPVVVPVKREAPPKRVATNAAPEKSPSDRVRELLEAAEEQRVTLLNKVATKTLSAVKGAPQVYTYFPDALEGEDVMGEPMAEMHRARQLYEVVLGMDPGNPQATLGLGNLALMEALSVQSTTTLIRYNLLVGRGMPRKKAEKAQELLQRRLEAVLAAADSKFRTVLAAAPMEPAGHLGLGMSMALRADWAKAIEKFEMMEKADILPQRNRSVMFVWYGFSLEQIGRKKDAIAKYQLAASYQEPYLWARFAQRKMEALYLSGDDQ
jgi:hypothetical protein